MTVEEDTKGIVGYFNEYFIKLDTQRYLYEVEYFPEMIKDYVAWYLLHQYRHNKKMLLHGYIRRYCEQHFSASIVNVFRLYHDTPGLNAYDRRIKFPYSCTSADGDVKRSISTNAEYWRMEFGFVTEKIEECSKLTLGKIWDKFDRKKSGELKFDFHVPRIMYAFIALSIKTQNRNGKPPKWNSLLPLVSFIAKNIKSQINEKNNTPDNNMMKRQDFIDNIVMYMKQVQLDDIDFINTQILPKRAT